MDIHDIRQLLKKHSIYQIKLRVTFYARVSTDSDEQENSLENQIAYYNNYIKSIEGWTLVPGYYDEGITGISTRKRERFNDLIEDGMAGKFDLVITKEISRFARNTVDSLMYTRNLLSAGVGVFFQNDNINTFDEDSELRLAIMSSIAQEESRKTSSRVKFGHAQAIKSGVVLGNSRIFGYIKDKGKLIIDEEQAQLVRELFEMYATNEYSLKALEDYFYKKGYRNYKGNKIAHSTLSGIISNPKYKGYYVGNKVKVVDMFTKKQKFLPPEEWVMFKDETGEIVPAIVDESLWNLANEVLKKRSDDVKGRQGICNHANLLTGKLFCTECGSPYYRRDSKDKTGKVNSKWVCSGKIKNGADSCSSFAIYEEEIKPILFEVLQETEVNTEALIEEYIAIFKEVTSKKSVTKQIAKATQSLEHEKKKKSKLIDLLLKEVISESDFKAMNEECLEKIAGLEKELYELEQERESEADMQKHIKEIKTMLVAAKEDASKNMISKDVVERYIDRIYVTPIGDGSAKLDIKIFTGESCEKFLSSLRTNNRVRTGHISKKMIPIRTFSFSRSNRNVLNHQTNITYSANIYI